MGGYEYIIKKDRGIKMSVIHISNGKIEEISSEGRNTLITVVYRPGREERMEEPRNQPRNEQRVRLVVEPRTIIVDSNGAFVPTNSLSVGMTINAAISSAMTRSIPPQATAYLIEIARRQQMENTIIGRILEIDRNNRSFTTISDRDLSSVIRFQVPENAIILNRAGGTMNFSGLSAGMRVRVRHANFMTASIPPQTTAFEIQIL